MYILVLWSIQWIAELTIVLEWWSVHEDFERMFVEWKVANLLALSVCFFFFLSLRHSVLLFLLIHLFVKVWGKNAQFNLKLAVIYTYSHKFHIKLVYVAIKRVGKGVVGDLYPVLRKNPENSPIMEKFFNLLEFSLNPPSSK